MADRKYGMTRREWVIFGGFLVLLGLGYCSYWTTACHWDGHVPALELIFRISDGNGKLVEGVRVEVQWHGMKSSQNTTGKDGTAGIRTRGYSTSGSGWWLLWVIPIREYVQKPTWDVIVIRKPGYITRELAWEEIEKFWRGPGRSMPWKDESTRKELSDTVDIVLKAE